jgi:hypothetical protein
MGYAHPTEMKDRPCPNGWTECAVCKHERACRAGLYHGENIFIKAAEIAERVTHKEAVESVNKIKGLQADTDFWAWWGRTSPPDLHSRIPLPLDGPSAPGGGGVKRRKQPVKKMPEYLKTFGQLT